MGKKLIRVFVSSTFSDFAEERRLLGEVIFPGLRDYCAARGFSFQAVDLRWGVSEQSALEHDTIKICLEEIERCQQVSAKPNFLLLMGNRYGWQPLPSTIELAEFERLTRYLEGHPLYDESSVLLREWYLPDDNAVPREVVLRGRGELTDDDWNALSDLLQIMLRTAAKGAGLSEREQEKYHLSATGYEIVKGALQLAERGLVSEHQVLCAFREIESIGAYVDVDRDKATWLDKLKSRLDGLFPQFSYDVKIGAGQEEALDGFGRRVEAMLRAAIDARISEYEESLSPLLLEQEQHRDFMEERARDFQGREDTVAHAVSYAKAPAGRAMLIYGPRGMGKSSVAAKIVSVLSEQWPERAVLVYRFTGVSAGSADAFSLVRSLCEELAQRYSRPFEPPASYAQACLLLKHSLSFADGEKPLCLMIDAVDQLVSAVDEDPLLWLSETLPEHAALIVTTREAAYADYAAGRLPKPLMQELLPLEAAHAEQALTRRLARLGRTLTPAQKALVLERFAETGLPIYLRLACEQAALWRSWQSPALSSGVAGIIRDYLSHLSSEAKHGREFVFKAFGYLASARDGLSESEMQELLTRDAALMADYRRRFPLSPATDVLPAMIWSRFYYDVASYLKEINAADTVLLGFYHLQIRDTVEEVFLRDAAARRALHGHLADYFDGRPVRLGKRPNLRKLSELPYHLMQIGGGDRLAALVSDLDYMRAKTEAGQFGALTDEIYWVFRQSESDGDLRERLARTLFRFVCEYNRETGREAVTTEDLHSLLIFRKDRDLHARVFTQGRSRETILELCPHLSEERAEALRLACVARLINLTRRMGRLDEAEALTKEVLLSLEGDGTRLADYSRVLYDLGYIRFLQGRFREARETMEESAAAAERGGNPVGMWISRCVATHINDIACLDTPDEAAALREDIRLLKEARQVFERYSDHDLNARRWISNVKQHLADAAFLLGDAAALRRYGAEYFNDPWVKNYDDKFHTSMAEAKLAAAEGRYEEACAVMEGFIAHKRELAGIDGSQVESFAESYYLLGAWLLKLGKTEAARQSFEQGLALGDEPGNHKWRARITRVIVVCDT